MTLIITTVQCSSGKPLACGVDVLCTMKSPPKHRTTPLMVNGGGGGLLP